MDYLLEIEGSGSDRKIFQYYDSEGNKGRKVTRKQHISDLQSSGKLLNIIADDVCFSTKRKRSVLDGESSRNPVVGPSKIQETTMETIQPHHGQLLKDRVVGDVSPESYSNQMPMDIEHLQERSSGGQQDTDLLNHDEDYLFEFDKGSAASDEESNGLESDLDSNSLGDNNLMDQNKDKESNNPTENDLTVKLKNEIQKKKISIECLKLSSEQPEMSEVCKLIDKFRSEVYSTKVVSDEEFKTKMINLLTDENSNFEDLQRFMAASHTMSEFFLDVIFQEALALSSQKSVLKFFPPNLADNFCLSLLEEARLFAPSLLSLLVKFCCKTNEPISEKQARKVVHHTSQLVSSVNQKNSLVQKLVSLKLKLSSITNSGLDFLNDLGITQSSRSLQRDHDYLASLNSDYLVEELKGKSFNYLVDNLDKMIDGTLVNFTSVILVVQPEINKDLGKVVDNSTSDSFFEPEYLKLDQISQQKYMSALVHILGHMLRNIFPGFDWVKNLLSHEFKHDFSDSSNNQTFWSYLSLLPLSEQKNSDMVEILSFLNEFFLEMLWRTSDHPDGTKALINIIKDSDADDDAVERAEEELEELAKKKGLPSVLGDQLTYERAFIGQKLRQGAISSIERFDFLKFRLAMFHALMAKVRLDYQEFLPSLSNTLDKGNLSYFRARLSKHLITNDGDKIKKGECSYFNLLKDWICHGDILCQIKVKLIPCFFEHAKERRGKKIIVAMCVTKH